MERRGSRDVFAVVLASALVALLSACSNQETARGGGRLSSAGYSAPRAGMEYSGLAGLASVSVDDRVSVDDDVVPTWALSRQEHQIVASVQPCPMPEPSGTLIVATRTTEVYDGEVRYHPHSPYTLFADDGQRLRRVRNHLGKNDESPARVKFPPGRYRVSADSCCPDDGEFFVLIEPGRTTRVDVAELPPVGR